jgi:pilus assembly protein CpaF
MVSEAVDLIVYCARGPGGPRVTEIAAVEDLVAGPEATQFTVTGVFLRAGRDQPLSWSGQVPLRLARRFELAGLDITDHLHEIDSGLRRTF